METESKMLFSDDPSDFVSVKEVVSDAILDIRYYSANNCIGDRVDGYEQEVALLTKEAAAALKKAGEEIRNRGLCFKIYDAYRPQMAVDHFVRWGRDLSDVRMKEYYYPEGHMHRRWYCPVPGTFPIERTIHNQGFQTTRRADRFHLFYPERLGSAPFPGRNGHRGDKSAD